MAQSTARRLASSMNERTVLVFIMPPPLTFAERRSVLQVLEQQGPLEVFRKRAGDSASYIAVAKDATTCARLTDQSPLTYDICVSESSANTTVPNPSKLTGNHRAVTAGSGSAAGVASHDAAGDSTAGERRTFHLSVRPATEYRHDLAIQNRSALSGPWPAHWKHDRSFMASVLQQSLPPTVAADGLAHWLFDDAPEKAAATVKDRLRRKAWRPSSYKLGTLDED